MVEHALLGGTEAAGRRAEAGGVEEGPGEERQALGRPRDAALVDPVTRTSSTPSSFRGRGRADTCCTARRLNGGELLDAATASAPSRQDKENSYAGMGRVGPGTDSGAGPRDRVSGCRRRIHIL